MIVKVKVLVCNYPFLLLQPPTGTYVRRHPRTAGMLYLREVFAKCQLNHLYGDVTHRWDVPTCHKTNLVAC